MIGLGSDPALSAASEGGSPPGLSKAPRSTPIGKIWILSVNGISLSASWEQLVKTTSLIRTNDSSLSLIEPGSELNWGKSVRQ